MLAMLKNHYSKHFVNQACGTLSDIRLIIASSLLWKADRARCWLGNVLLPPACSECDGWSASRLLNSDPDLQNS